MNQAVKVYDCIIIGGGVGGLSLAIQLAKLKLSILLLEKEAYPHHKVCGEYISMESWPFLERIGLSLENLKLPIITKLEITTPKGYILNHTLDLGGFGISRYELDNQLYLLAINNGAEVLQSSKVEEIFFDNNIFTILTLKETFQAKVVVGSWGKRSNMDIKWNRKFSVKQKAKLANYIGVKYHLKTSLPADTIQLHNFKDGYCGISKVEGDKYCLCYLTTSKNLKKYGSIATMEKEILWSNPYLKHYFTESTFLFEKPVTVSQISFLPKKLVENHVLMLGDAAGLITPLCGNGMSMAFQASFLLTSLITEFIEGKINLEELHRKYIHEWKKEFAERLATGRNIQSLFGKKWATEIFIRTMSYFPKLTSLLIKKTHGHPF